jgi:hypothetical protein
MKKEKDPAAVSLGSRGGKAKAAKRTKAQRKQEASRAASFPRKKDVPRCFCGKRTLHTATLRAFDCCKKAGKYPETTS